MIPSFRSRAFWIVLLAGGAVSSFAAMSACSSSSSSPSPTQDSSVEDTLVAEGGTDTSTNDGGDAGCPGATDAASLDEAQVATGQDLVHSFGCPRCHQSTPEDAGIVLSGQTTSIVDGGAIYPKNLTPDPATGIGCWTDTQIETAILTGIDDQGQPLCVMPKFGALGMDSTKAAAIVAFLRSLPAVSHLIPESTCPTGDAGTDGGGPDGGPG